jgi:hypothetical protein
MRSRSGDPWAPYVPDEPMPWHLRRVVHLHRRAGFAATWDGLQRNLKDGPEASIDRLRKGKSRSYSVPGRQFVRKAKVSGNSEQMRRSSDLTWRLCVHFQGPIDDS